MDKNTHIEDALLMKAVSEGDKDAFTEIVTRYGSLISRTSLKITCSWQDSQDITQDVLMKIWRKASSYNGHYSLPTWIYRITSNLCIDFLRKRKIPHTFTSEPQSDCSLPEGCIPADISAEDRMIIKEEWKIFTEAASKLTPRQRTVFTLRELEGLSTEETAEATGMSSEQIKSNLYLARKAVRSALGKRQTQ